MEQPILGIDVAKQKLEVALLWKNQTFTNQFDNASSGFKSLQTWRASLPVTQVHACLEATGSYGDAVAFFCTTPLIWFRWLILFASKARPIPNCRVTKPIPPMRGCLLISA